MNVCVGLDSQLPTWSRERVCLFVLLLLLLFEFEKIYKVCAVQTVGDICTLNRNEESFWLSLNVCLCARLYVYIQPCSISIIWEFQHTHTHKHKHIKSTLLSSFLRSDWEQTLELVEWANYIDINYNIINDTRDFHIRFSVFRSFPWRIWREGRPSLFASLCRFLNHKHYDSSTKLL